MATQLEVVGADQQFNQHVTTFTNFLDPANYAVDTDTDYKAKIKTLIEAGQRRLIVSVDDLRAYNRQYCDNLLKHPADYLPAFDKALKDIVLSLAPNQYVASELEQQEFHVGLDGSFGDHYVNPRSLSAKHLGKMIAIEGIVTKCSLVRGKVVRSVHYCQATQLFSHREYRDFTSLGTDIPTPAIYPKTDDQGNPLTTEYGYCTYRDHQTISIQEMPERAPAGQLPRPIDVILDDDLVDKCKPGDRVCLVGVYRSLGKGNGAVSTFRTLLIANHVRLLSRDSLTLELTEHDILKIREVSKREDIFELLSNSLAPSIYNTTNMKYIKKAVLMQLLGGMEKNLENGTHIRGDINVLLIGDPSTAKSQILRFVTNTAPLAITTTGRGSSGVGLTAAVTTDKETGERRLEAGAMVLADRGIVCIDEFDKMGDNDRVAIHEVMEQQTVTITKAGIHTTLNARCSVIAAANPAYGQYIDRRRPFENIALPDSLLSRFDLLFIVIDEVDEEYDRAISEHVLRMHRYTPPDLEEGVPVNDSFANAFSAHTAAALKPDEEADDGEPFERFNKLLHTNGDGGSNPSAPKSSRKSRKGKNNGNRANLLKMNFIKKYIHYAKMRVQPRMSMEAADLIANTYADLRNKKLEEEQHRMEKTLPVTARMLETLMRLSTAHAKSRLSNVVTKEDAEVAKELLEFVLYKEVKEDPRKKKKRRVADAVEEESGSDDEDDEEDSDEEGDDAGDRNYGSKSRGATPRTAGRARRQGNAGQRDMAVDEEEEEDADLTNEVAPGFSSRANITSLIDTSFDVSSQRGMTSMDLLDGMPTSSQAGPSASASQVDLDDERLSLFRQRLHAFREANPTEELVPFDILLPAVNRALPSKDSFGLGDMMAALKQMEKENQVMVDADSQSVAWI